MKGKKSNLPVHSLCRSAYAPVFTVAWGKAVRSVRPTRHVRGTDKMLNTISLVIRHILFTGITATLSERSKIFLREMPKILQKILEHTVMFTLPANLRISVNCVRQKNLFLCEWRTFDALRLLRVSVKSYFVQTTFHLHLQ